MLMVEVAKSIPVSCSEVNFMIVFRVMLVHQGAEVRMAQMGRQGWLALMEYRCVAACVISYADRI